GGFRDLAGDVQGQGIVQKATVVSRQSSGKANARSLDCALLCPLARRGGLADSRAPLGMTK
ncbi:MAG TPA: hypothetical protein VK657_02930, partial [Terriglobales bacterium]|nr:hypothetical protein [Terriglobales bacterium]